MEIHVASVRITGDNAGTPHIPIDDESIIDLLGEVSDVEEQVEVDDPYISIETPAINFESASSSEEQVALTGPTNDHHQATILFDLLVDQQIDNATL